MSKPVDDLLQALDGIDPPDLWEAISASAEATTAEAEADESVDLVLVDLFQRGPFDSEAHPKRRRWSGVVGAVAATILVVAGVFVVANGNSSDLVTEPASSPGAADSGPSPSVLDPISGYRWARVPHDEAVFGGEGFQLMASVTVGGPGLVAVGFAVAGAEHENAAVWTSVDGIAWSRVPHDEAVFGGESLRQMESVTVGGPGLVAVGWGPSEGPPGIDDEDAAVWTSLDGITWSAVPHDEAVFGGEGFQWMRSVTVGGPGLVAVGSDGSEGNNGDAAVWTSVDGITWSRVPHDEAVFGGQSMESVTVGGRGLVAVGSSGPWGEKDAAVWTSVDGIAWARVPQDETGLGGDGGQLMASVTVGGPGLVAVGWSGSWGDQDAAVWTSVDGIAWSRVPHDEAVFGGEGNLGMTGVTAASQGLVAVGFVANADQEVAAVWTSVDGIAWSQVPLEEAVSGGEDVEVMMINGVTVAGQGLVAVGAGGSRDDLDAAVWTFLEGIS